MRLSADGVRLRWRSVDHHRPDRRSTRLGDYDHSPVDSLVSNGELAGYDENATDTYPSTLVPQR